MLALATPLQLQLCAVGQELHANGPERLGAERRKATADASTHCRRKVRRELVMYRVNPEPLNAVLSIVLSQVSETRPGAPRFSDSLRSMLNWECSLSAFAAGFADGFDLLDRDVEELQKLLVFGRCGALEFSVPAIHLLARESA